MTLAEAMPRWERRERHSVRTDAASDVLLQAVEDLTWREVPAFRALMGLRFGGWRQVPPEARVFEWFEREGFRRVARTDEEIVVVAVHPTGRDVDPARASGAGGSVTAFRDFADPGYVKIALDFRCVDRQLTTETRVRATDGRSRRLLAVYWLLVRPGGGLVRRVWLAAVRARAERSTGSR